MMRLASFAVLALAGCAAFEHADVISYRDVNYHYSPSTANVFAASGGLTWISGTTRDGASVEEIASQIKLPARFRSRKITLAPEGESPEGPHLALIIAPQNLGTNDAACRGDMRGGQAGPELKIYAVFCSNTSTAAASAMIRLADSPIPSDPDFAKRLSRVIIAVFPSYDPQIVRRRF